MRQISQKKFKRKFYDINEKQAPGEESLIFYLFVRCSVYHTKFWDQ